MINIFFILLCVILTILFGKMINVDRPKSQNVLAKLSGAVGRGNFTYFYVYSGGPIILNLTSILGDADLYVSETVNTPTYDPDTYSLHSATCGSDVVEIPDSFEPPLAVGVYGYADSSVFQLEVQENPYLSYPYKQWVVIKKEVAGLKESVNEEVENSDASTEAGPKHRLKKKKGKNSASMSSIFSVLEILQLIFPKVDAVANSVVP